MSLDKQKINQRIFSNLPKFSIMSQPQNTEFSNNSKTFHPRYIHSLDKGVPYPKLVFRPLNKRMQLKIIFFNYQPKPRLQ